MTQRIKTFLIYLFITVVVLLVATVTVLLVFHDIKTPFKKLFKHEEPSVTSVEEITEKVEKEHEAELSKEEEEAAKPPLEECIVETIKGKIKGQKKEVKYSTDNETYYAFQGIRYAEPPVKEFRFKEPQPTKNWDGVRDATTEGDICPQKKFPGLHETEVIGSEDCLFLNVYTPQKPEEDNTSLKPVMIWIHGGGFQFGSGSSDYYGPDFIVKNNVLLVTFNYRLGALGFLNLRVEGAPGNAGLKDMVAVMKWVQENISKFGGDPKNVTLFGEDAGAAAIQVFMVLPQIRESGLFHKVILQSGSIMNPWAYDDEPEKDGLDLVDELKIKSQGYTEILESLYKAEVENIVLAQDKIVSLDRIEKLELFAFVPSLEDPIQKDVNTEPGLLTVSPYVAFSSGRVPEIPTIIGFNNAEANIVFLYYPELITPKVLETLNNLPDSFLPRIISSIDSALFKNLTLNTIKKFYFNNERISWKHLPQFMDGISDNAINIGVYMSIELTKNYLTPVYVYEFEQKGKLNYFGNKAEEIFNFINSDLKKKITTNTKARSKYIKQSLDEKLSAFDELKLTGASHMDELGYLFLVNKFDKEKIPVDSTEYKVRERMCKLWTNFAKTSNPNADNEINDLEWPKSTSKKPMYLKIGNEIEVMEGNVESRRYNFWKTIFTAAFQENPGVIYDYLNKNKKDVIGK